MVLSCSAVGLTKVVWANAGTLKTDASNVAQTVILQIVILGFL
jgi:hypothetical protein